MKNLWHKLWYTEPVVFVGALVSGWTALAAFDVANDGFNLPLWTYAVAAVLVPAMTILVRGNVTPINDG